LGFSQKVPFFGGKLGEVFQSLEHFDHAGAADTLRASKRDARLFAGLVQPFPFGKIPLFACVIKNQFTHGAVMMPVFPFLGKDHPGGSELLQGGGFPLGGEGGAKGAEKSDFQAESAGLQAGVEHAVFEGNASDVKLCDARENPLVKTGTIVVCERVFALIYPFLDERRIQPGS
jgi:hypothetical protein